jgi:hypothetical protein
LRDVHPVCPGGIRNTCARRSACGNGSGRMIVALTTAITAAAAPMTSASEATLTRV